MIEQWTYRSTQRRLRIFISSRLKECAAERAAAKASISGIRHEPVLFEHLGARPYSARDLYLSHLRDSQAMVAIYKTGYGYIDTANGMSISGLEDEYRFAKLQGIDTLFYIYSEEAGRDTRLAEIINEVQSGPNTIWFYGAPNDLEDRIADDLNAMITERFNRSPKQIDALKETSSIVVSAVSKKGNGLLPRKQPLMDIEELLQKQLVVCIHGPPGIGKTTLSAQFAESRNALFVRLSGLPPTDIFAVCAIALGHKHDIDLLGLSTLDSARQAFSKTWERRQEALLVIDECEFIGALLEAIDEAGGLSAAKRVIFTSRTPAASYANLNVPPLNAAEIQTLIGAVGLNSGKLTVPAVSGNPLDVQRAILEATLIQRQHSDPIAPSGREIMSYLALSDTPLSADSLIRLREQQGYSIEQLYSDVASLAGLVEDSPRGLRLMHAETAAALLSELQDTPQRLQFYARRLLRNFEVKGEFVQAYRMAGLAGDGSQAQYAIPALREAARGGDLKRGVEITRKLLEENIEHQNKEEAFEYMLSLVYPLEMMGDTEQATTLLAEAKVIASDLGGDALFRYEETEISSRARLGMSVEDIAKLRLIYDQYASRADSWNQARVGLEIAANLIASKDYESAVEVCRTVLQLFSEQGDEYGAELAQRNLISALSGLPNTEREVDDLLTIVEHKDKELPDSRRQRAWLCNVLIRRYRREGKFSEAEVLAKEAIDIGSKLGDEYVRALNLVNLGNVYVGQKAAELALAAYLAAVDAANKCGRRSIAADGLRLAAGVLNDFEEMQIRSDRYLQARVLSSQAIDILKGTVNPRPLGYAHLEHGSALENLERLEEAAEAYFDAGAMFLKANADKEAGWCVLRAARLSIRQHTKLYFRKMGEIFNQRIDIDAPSSRSLEIFGQLLDVGPEELFLAFVAPILERTPRSTLIPLLGLHLRECLSRLEVLDRSAFAKETIACLQKFAAGPRNYDRWRVLLGAIAMSALLRGPSLPVLFYQIGSAIMKGAEDVFVRSEGGFIFIWTVILRLGERRITISIRQLDDSQSGALASLIIAAFLKAFERELHRDLVGSAAATSELLIYISELNEIPDDVRSHLDREHSVSEILRRQACVVTRPTEFEDGTPTYIVLGPRFLSRAVLGKGMGGSIQELLGLTLLEIVNQFLRGEVEMDAIHPKIVSLVRKTVS